MEEGILETLETIRGYVFIVMCAVVIWALFKVIELNLRIFSRFQEALEDAFEKKIEKLMNEGDYERVVSKCAEKLEKYPKHADAIWLTAKAYYHQGNNVQAKEYFEIAVVLVPSWEETAKPYLEKINLR